MSRGAVSILERFTRTAAKRRRSRKRVREESELLRPGLFVAAGDTLWRHWMTPVPQHLRRTRITPPGPRSQPAAPRQFLRTIRSRLKLLVPPQFFWNGRRGTGSFSLATSTHDGGVVLLDPEHGQVARTYGTGAVGSDYVALRRRFERHVPSPAFEVADHGRIVFEEFVDGVHVLDLPPEIRLEATRELFRRYADLVRNDREGDSHALLAPIAAVIREATLPPRLRAVVDADILTDRARTWPLIPSATDAHPKNLMVVDRCTPVPIDLGKLRLVPFFSYPIGLIVNARRDLLAAYLDGRLDGEVVGLFAAAGATFSTCDEDREALLGIRVLVRSYKEAAGYADRFERARFDHEVERRWARLWTGHPVSYR